MMAWPQFIMLGLVLLATGSSIAKFGQPKGVGLDGKQQRYDLIEVLVAPSLTIFLLWAGNFWEAGAKWP